MKGRAEERFVAAFVPLIIITLTEEQQLQSHRWQMRAVIRTNSPSHDAAQVPLLRVLRVLLLGHLIGALSQNNYVLQSASTSPFLQERASHEVSDSFWPHPNECNSFPPTSILRTSLAEACAPVPQFTPLRKGH